MFLYCNVHRPSFIEGVMTNIECNGLNSCKGAVINPFNSINIILNVYK